MKNLSFLFFMLLFFNSALQAQVGINPDSSPPDPSAGLDVNFTNKGFLPPRIALTANNAAAPVTSPAIGLLVYNTANAGAPPINVVPGYYYWNGTKWISVVVPTGTNVGDMLYWNGTQWINIPVGTNGQVLTLSNGVPAWGGAQVPLISTMPVIFISSTTAVSGGEIIFDGGSLVSQRGVCWNTLSNPTTSDVHTTDGTGTGSFTSNMTGLTANTLYYVRAYATNSMGTSYGSQVSFTTTNVGTPPTVTTASITNITETTANGGGNVTSQGSSSVTARGVCWNTSSNPTTSDVHTTDGTGTGSFTSNITGLTANTLYYVRSYATNSVGTAYGNEVSFTTATWSCGSTFLINHVATGVVAPVNKTVNYGTVTNILGETSKCWITSNLGADHQATAVNDATEASAGWYWQFNRKQGYKHDGTNRTPNTTWISWIDENLDWQFANDPCALELGAGWRIPTKSEWTNLYVGGNWTNWNGPWNSGLKLHAAGYFDNYDGSLDSRGSYGSYWSSTQYDSGLGWDLSFDSGDSNMNRSTKSYGSTARCLRD